MYDICIIGAGVVGCAIARELSKYDLNICMLDKSDDVSNGASKANSGIVHGGYAAKYGTLKGKLNFEGNILYEKLNSELNFGYRKTGGLVLGFSEDDLEALKKLYENGIKNGVKSGDMEILSSKEIIQLEPNINKEVKYALYAKDVGVTSPYEFTIALAENSIENGVELFLENEVISISKQVESFVTITQENKYESKYVINAAGVYSDKIANMMGINNFYIEPKRGQYILLQKEQGYLANTVLFQIPTKIGKGILVTQTYHGNLMLGPNAEEVDERDNLSTTKETLDYIIDTARKSVPNFDVSKILTTFSGMRPISSTGDFVIEESSVTGFINVGGIDSPGLTSSPAIALKVVGILLTRGLILKEKKNFNPYRKSILIKKDSGFKGIIDSLDPSTNIICRCEKITEIEIINALNRGIKIKSIDGIKRRTRAGMGYCQGKFCGPRVRSLIAKELNISEEEVTKRGPKSSIILNRVLP